MSIIVEDGSGLANSECYISVADADTYHSNRNNTAWASLSTAIKEASLRKATDYMIGIYRLRWLGRRRLTTQALDWPRVGVVLEDFGNVQFGSYGLFQVSYTIVPNEIKNACAEFALRASTANLVDDQTQKTIEETVGPITVKYDTNSSQSIRYPQIQSMLNVYLINHGNSAMRKLIRS